MHSVTIENIQKKVEAKKTLTPEERIILRKHLEQIGKGEKTSQVFVSNIDKKEVSTEMIEIDKIKTYHSNTDKSSRELRDRFIQKDDQIEQLAKSIEKVGLLQPIVVQKTKDGFYKKIAGNRRIEAYKLLNKKKIKAIVLEDDSDIYQSNLRVLHENIMRKDLNPVEKLYAVLHFIQHKFNTDQEGAKKIILRANNLKKGNISNVTDEDTNILSQMEKILSETGVYSSVSHLAKYLTLMNMHELILQNLTSGKVSFDLAQKLHKLKDIEWNGEWTYDAVIEYIIEEEKTQEDIADFVKEHGKTVTDSKKEKTIPNMAKSIAKKASKLPIEKKEALMKELKKIEKKFFKE